MMGRAKKVEEHVEQQGKREAGSTAVMRLPLPRQKEGAPSAGVMEFSMTNGKGETNTGIMWFSVSEADLCPSVIGRPDASGVAWPVQGPDVAKANAHTLIKVLAENKALLFKCLTREDGDGYKSHKKMMDLISDKVDDHRFRTWPAVKARLQSNYRIAAHRRKMPTSQSATAFDELVPVIEAAEMENHRKKLVNAVIDVVGADALKKAFHLRGNSDDLPRDLHTLLFAPQFLQICKKRIRQAKKATKGNYASCDNCNCMQSDSNDDSGHSAEGTVQTAEGTVQTAEGPARITEGPAQTVEGPVQTATTGPPSGQLAHGNHTTSLLAGRKPLRVGGITQRQVDAPSPTEDQADAYEEGEIRDDDDDNNNNKVKIEEKEDERKPSSCPDVATESKPDNTAVTRSRVSTKPAAATPREENRRYSLRSTQPAGSPLTMKTHGAPRSSEYYRPRRDSHIPTGPKAWVSPAGEKSRKRQMTEQPDGYSTHEPKRFHARRTPSYPQRYPEPVSNYRRSQSVNGRARR
ncbi:hypothetical protein GGS20DRAFT_397255 [Poronia punctata]|nr:hypothetical protein GGS20DRAFT_397255 [Poronia punctata]